jgi:hypothetical protein
MKLLLSQKNNLFDLIEKFGLTPGLFEYKEYETGKEIYNTTISLKKSSFLFSVTRIVNNTRDASLRFSPGDIRYEDSSYAATWYDIESTFKYWLKYLKREIQLEDKWEKLNSEIQSLQLYKEEGDFLNSKFTVPEYLEIKQKIFLLKEGIAKLELLPEQIALLNDKLDLVLDLTTQLGRFDWKSLFIGTIVSIIIQLGVTQDNAKAIWALIKQVFHNYFIGQ